MSQGIISYINAFVSTQKPVIQLAIGTHAFVSMNSPRGCCSLQVIYFWSTQGQNEKQGSKQGHHLQFKKVEREQKFANFEFRIEKTLDRKYVMESNYRDPFLTENLLFR